MSNDKIIYELENLGKPRGKYVQEMFIGGANLHVQRDFQSFFSWKG